MCSLDGHQGWDLKVKMYILTRHLWLHRFKTSTKYIKIYQVRLESISQNIGAAVGNTEFSHLNPSRGKNTDLLCDDLNHSEKHFTLSHNHTQSHLFIRTKSSPPTQPKEIQYIRSSLQSLQIDRYGVSLEEISENHDNPTRHEPGWRAWRRDPEAPGSALK